MSSLYLCSLPSSSNLHLPQTLIAKSCQFQTAKTHHLSSFHTLVYHRSTTSAKSRFLKASLVKVNCKFGEDLDFFVENGMQGFLTLPSPRPGPVQFPRKELNQRFAVLLMRSSYQATDDLDFIPMDKFQAQFWKLRQAELEPYTIQLKPLRVQYGILTDPLYFDFISFAQYATISNAMYNGQLIFEEKINAGGESQIVKRNDQLLSNDDLPKAFKKRMGNLIYSNLLNGFEGETFDCPSPCDENSSFSCIVDGVDQLMRLFQSNGYCLDYSVKIVEAFSTGGGRFKVKINGSATLWGVRAISSRRFQILNDFESMVVNGFLESSGRSASYRSRFTDTFCEHLWTVV